MNQDDARRARSIYAAVKQRNARLKKKPPGGGSGSVIVTLRFREAVAVLGELENTGTRCEVIRELCRGLRRCIESLEGEGK